MMRLPLTDPKYRYPPSKNPYWAKIVECDDRVLTDSETEIHSGTWLERTRAQERLHVEIGCNGGHFLNAMAKRHPHDGFIGIDYKFKQIFRAHEKSKKKGLKNTIYLRANAIRLPFIFEPGEIDFLYFYFPDPWPKKSHEKNRLLRSQWLKDIASLLSPKGRFEIRTDHRNYYQYLLEELTEASREWEIELATDHLYQGHPNPLELKPPEVTLFESIYLKEGIRIHSIVLRPKAVDSVGSNSKRPLIPEC